ncbi:histidine kinase dimerization/phospho-acceptor domain-containing protein [Nonomuraea angiospora]|uniref:histidine kinase dimerization/phospho-acceptor domain-containing protein n=1 Tax=Nonomuraea angiospora TaxID=46172 RepID=UPI0033253CB8
MAFVPSQHESGQKPMRPQINYEAAFNALTAPNLVLTPDFVIVGVNDAYAQETGRDRADLLGRHLFAAFPENPNAGDDPEARGVEELRASLERVLANGQPDTMALQRYDIEAHDRSGVFEERYWTGINTPVLGPGGEVELIIHRGQDVTDFVRQVQRFDQRSVKEARTQLEVTRTRIYTHARELYGINEHLRQEQKQYRRTISAQREMLEQQRQLVFDASQDLRNAITGLLAELQVALSTPDTDGRQILHKLLTSAERLNDIVADLLDLARRESVTRAPPNWPT